jgi:hypothetical protein
MLYYILVRKTKRYKKNKEKKPYKLEQNERKSEWLLAT